MAKKTRKVNSKSAAEFPKSLKLTPADVIAFNEFFVMGLSAGCSPYQCLDYCAAFCESPLREELGQSLNEMRLGRPIEDALVLLANTVRSHHFGMSARSIILAMRTGATPVAFLRLQNEILAKLPYGKPLRESRFQDLPTISSL